MTLPWTDDRNEPLPTTAEPAVETPAYDCEIVLSRDRPAECTIYPRDAAGLERLTTWITATEGSFVSLEDRR